METERLVEALEPIRLPVEYTQVNILELVGAFALGSLAALAAVLVVRPFLARRKDPVAEARKKIAKFADQPKADRLLSLARLHAATGGSEPPVWLHEALYRRDVPVDFSALEAAILRAAATTKTRPGS
ncbi:MAG: hypothetical protein AAGB11_16345 [Pseudomonadota bacterium]